MKRITKLKKKQVFVFGSNLAGNHIGGAAKDAVDYFGAIEGKAEGIQGQSYAIPTLTRKMKKSSLKAIRNSVDRFLKYAKKNSDKQFIVTPVGTGIAGFKVEDIRPLFRKSPNNVILPEEFEPIVKRYKFLRSGLRSENGNHKWEIGKWYKSRGRLELCSKGFHCSKGIYQAFSYIHGEILAEVEVRGERIIEDSKEVWKEMKVIKCYEWTKTDSVLFSIFAAKQVIHLFEEKYPKDKRPRKAIEAAEAYIQNPSKKNKRAADAAADAAYAAYAAADACAAASAASAAAYAAASAASAAADAYAAAADAAYAAYAAADAYAAASAASAAADAKERIYRKLDKWMLAHKKELQRLN